MVLNEIEPLFQISYFIYFIYIFFFYGRVSDSLIFCAIYSQKKKRKKNWKIGLYFVIALSLPYIHTKFHCNWIITGWAIKNYSVKKYEQRYKPSKFWNLVTLQVIQLFCKKEIICYSNIFPLRAYKVSLKLAYKWLSDKLFIVKK